VATDSPRDTTNRNQPLLFFNMDPTSTIASLWKKCVLADTGGRNANPEKTSNSVKFAFRPSEVFPETHFFRRLDCMCKEEFHWFCGDMQGWFWAKLGLKISDGPQQPALFLWQLTAPRAY
jgi:hypothetical protein